jgi:hypothetical protein
MRCSVTSFEALVSAALRLDRLQFREWLRKGLRNPPLCALDPAAFAISDRDMSLLLKQLPFRADDADRGSGTLPPAFAVWSVSATTSPSPSRARDRPFVDLGQHQRSFGTQAMFSRT